MGRTHALSGAVLGLAVCATVPPRPELVPVVVVVCALAAFAPDLDHPSSTATNSLGPITWGLCWLIRNLSVAAGLPAHRGLSHSLPFALFVGVLAGAATLYALPAETAAWTGAAAALGCWCGALGDELTTTGNRYACWPLGQVRWPDSLRFRTGGRGEQVVAVLLAVTGCALLPAALGA